MIDGAFEEGNMSHLSAASSTDSTDNEFQKEKASINVVKKQTSSRTSQQISRLYRTTKDMVGNLLYPQPSSREIADQQSKEIDEFLVDEAKKRYNHIEIVICEASPDWVPVMKQMQEERPLPLTLVITYVRTLSRTMV